jgi:signal transduction histidine kinase
MVAVSGPDVQVLADGFRLEQVLICLLDNAVKHASRQSTVGVAWLRDGSRVVIGVSDQGEGIDAADMARLFTRFGRVERTMGQRHGGIGLGLYIARQLTEAMGGAIWVKTERGAGSTFYVSVPAVDEGG